MSYLAIIPARGGSKGLPNKNILPLAGKPLIAWTIEQSLATTQVARTVVSTDSTMIAKVSREFGADVPFLRPDSLAGDTATTESAMLHCIEWLEQHEGSAPSAVVLLQCTSPFRYADRITQAIELFEQSKADSLLSASPFWHFLWQQDISGAKALYDFQNRPRRQDIAVDDYKYKENGSIYITSTKALKQTQNRLSGRIALFEMSEEESFEIDSKADFRLVEQNMQQYLDLANHESD